MLFEIEIPRLLYFKQHFDTYNNHERMTAAVAQSVRAFARMRKVGCSNPNRKPLDKQTKRDHVLYFYSTTATKKCLNLNLSRENM